MYSKAVITQLFDSLGTRGVLLFDTELRYLLVEGSVLHDLGYTPEAMVGRTPFEALDPVDAAQVYDLYLRALDGDTFSVPYYSEFHDRHYMLDFAPSRGVRGEVTGGRLFVEEVTEQEHERQRVAAKLEEAERMSHVVQGHACQLRAIVDASPFAIAMFDTQMRYVACSHRWYEEYDLDPAQDLLGRRHYDVFPEIGARWKQDHRRTLAGETLENEAEVFERADGSIDHVHWRNVPWYAEDGEVAGIIMFTRVLEGVSVARTADTRSTDRSTLRTCDSFV